MSTNLKSEGARAERKAQRARLRRRIAYWQAIGNNPARWGDRGEDAKGEREFNEAVKIRATVAASVLDEELTWLLDRESRYSQKAGGL